MVHVAAPSLVRQLGILFEGGCSAGLSDRQLLERFIAPRESADEAAFAAIVARHGPMVLGVCRQLLGDHHHAEDAFQAVFLVLARRARSIRDPDLLGTWLYGVAFRTARKARGKIARRRRTEEEGAVRHGDSEAARPADRAMIEREQAEALHCEIDRLPGTFRTPVVLCYFEGLTLDEAAHRLRWPPGTLRSRLARARGKLRRALTRRGFALSATAIVSSLVPRSAPASVSPLLCDSTARAAIQFVAPHAAGAACTGPAALLAQEVLGLILLHKLKVAALSVAFMAVVACGVGLLIRPAAMGDEPKTRPRTADSVVVAKPADVVPRRMTVVGRVLDPQGKPVPSASVMLYGAPAHGDGRPNANAPAEIGRAGCDGTGRYRLDAPRISTATHYMVGAAAVAPGFGTGWVNLDMDADEPVANITLMPEQVIQGRLFDLQGRPAAGARVSVEGLGQPDRTQANVPEFIDGPHFWAGNRTKSLKAWPRPAITDSEGRFTVHGVGRGIRALLMADDPRFARQRIVVDTDTTAETKAITAALEPANVIAGRVTYADTGKPVPHAAIEIIAHRRGVGRENHFDTDDDGRFRANPISADRYSVSVYAPEGEPYLNTTTWGIVWTKGAVERRLDLSLERGTVIRGTVTEEGSGRPVAGALLGFIERQAAQGASGPSIGRARSGPEGSYLLAVLPKAGTLIVLGPGDEYVLLERGERMVRDGQPGGQRWYAHAFIPCDVKPGDASREVNVVLRRGKTVTAQVSSPDGHPVPGAWVLSRLLLPAREVPWGIFRGNHHGDVRNGHFELHGLGPDAEAPAFFLDSNHKLGATVRFSACSDSSGPVKVRLEPCGVALARLVDPNGRPLPGYRTQYLITMIVTPGKDLMSAFPPTAGQLVADEAHLSRIDPEHYTNLASDAQGRVRFDALVPGATYRVIDRTTPIANGTHHVRKEFVAQSGKTIDLGDILIEKPES